MRKPAIDRSRIENGIEFFTIGGKDGIVRGEQCARCGSSCFFRRCDNCAGDGVIDEEDDWEWPATYPCDWCRGIGGWWRCLSSKDWCEKHPMPGRDDQPVMGCESHEYED